MNRYLLIVVVCMTSCVTRQEPVQTGAFSGSLDLRWIGPNRFLFVPNETDPFQFTRANGEVVKPGAMYTDGGSAPSFLQWNTQFSAWGYGPAFVLHDWLFFEASQRNHDGQAIDFEDAGFVLAEAMETLAEKGHMPKNRTVRRLYQKAVSGRIARKTIWMHPWYGDLPPPAEAVNQPSLAYGQPLPFVEERPVALIIKSADQLRAELEEEPNLLTNE